MGEGRGWCNLVAGWATRLDLVGGRRLKLQSGDWRRRDGVGGGGEGAVKRWE